MFAQRVKITTNFPTIIANYLQIFKIFSGYQFQDITYLPLCNIS